LISNSQGSSGAQVLRGGIGVREYRRRSHCTSLIDAMTFKTRERHWRNAIS
jgi:hypothetical protein